MKIVDLLTHQLSYTTFNSGLTHAIFSPNDQLILTASRDGQLRLWDAKTRNPVGKAMKHVGVSAAAFSPDGSRIVTTGSRDEPALLWDARVCELLGSLGPVSLHEIEVGAAMFTGDSRRIVTQGTNGSAIWNAADGRRIHELRHEHHSNAFFSPNGEHIVVHLYDDWGTTLLWDANTGEVIGELNKGRGAGFVLFSQDNQTLLTMSHESEADGGSVRLWDVYLNSPLEEESQRGACPWTMDFGPDGLRFLTVDDNEGVQIWDTMTGLPLGDPLRHPDTVERAVFSPDGSKVLTVSLDGKVWVWNSAISKRRTIPADNTTWGGAETPHSPRFNLIRKHDRKFEKEGNLVEVPKPSLKEQAYDLFHLAGLHFDGDGRTQQIPNNQRVEWRNEQFSGAPNKENAWTAILRRRLFGAELQSLGLVTSSADLAKFDTELRIIEETINRELEGPLDAWDYRASPNPVGETLETGPVERTAFNSLIDAYDLNPGFPLIHIALAAVELNAERKAFLEKYGLNRLEGVEVMSAKAPHHKYDGTYRAKAAGILWLHGDKSLATEVYAELVSKFDPARKTWGSRAWLEQLHELDEDNYY